MNKIELTKQKFITNPFKRGGMIYRSGDIARILNNGELEYLGRKDFQVKIRGFRIELREIEAQILNHNDIKEAVVITREDKNLEKYLCAYIISEKKCSDNELKNYLSKKLPDYMIPAYFVQLDKMPLTINGKVDRKALPDQLEDIRDITEYIAPTQETEISMAKIWKSILALEKIGIKENFFNIGGDSIKAIKLIHLINEEFEVDLKIADLYLNNTIKDLSEKVNKLKIGKAKIDNDYLEAVMEVEEFKNRIVSG